MPEHAGPVASAVERRTREWEAANLSLLATPSYGGRGRAFAEEICGLRTPFQRDRDRIVHTKAFRRLMHKTQVFMDPEGDHYRTRLTHTLETTMISRTVARALRLNEDLTEAIGLGHDLGHTPFGHAGEEALDRCVQRAYGRRFAHNEHSLRIVEVLEREGRGLNLAWETRDGILNHRGAGIPATLEGKIVRIVDRIAYINHDIDDAVRAGVLDETELPRDEIAVLGPTGSKRIDTLVHDLIETSAAQGADIVQGAEIGAAMLSLRSFMFTRVYLSDAARAEHAQAHGVVEQIFEHLRAHPEALPDGPGELADRVTDFLAGMTDRYALAYAAKL